MRPPMNRRPNHIVVLAALLALTTPAALPASARAAVDLAAYDRYLNGGAITSRPSRPVAPPGSTIADESRQSDEAFLDELLAADEKAATEDAAAAPEAQKPAGGAFRLSGEWFSSNRRPGYMLFTGVDPDYRSRGNRLKVGGSPMRGFTVTAGRTAESFGDGTTADVALGTTDLTLAGKLPVAGRFSLTLRRKDGAVPRPLDELEAGGWGKIAGLNLGLEAARRHHASDADSCAAPAPYNRFGVSIGGDVGGGLYAELRPSCASYPDDGNAMREAAGGLYCYPAGVDGLTLDLHGRSFAYARDGSENSFVYFSPTAGTNLGAGIDWTIKLPAGCTVDLGLSVDRESYTLGGIATGYYTSSGQAVFDARLPAGLAFRGSYGFDLTALGEYPVTQNLRASLDYRF